MLLKNADPGARIPLWVAIVAVHSYIYNNDLSKPTTRRCIMAKSILEALLPEVAEIFQDNAKMQNIVKRFDKSENMTLSPLS